MDEIKNDTTTKEPVMNEYLSLREAKIARNHARLQELGLLKEPTTRNPSSSNSRNRPPARKLHDRSYNRRSTSRDPYSSTSKSTCVAPTTLRRSRRLQQEITSTRNDFEVVEQGIGGESSVVTTSPSKHRRTSSSSSSSRVEQETMMKKRRTAIAVSNAAAEKRTSRGRQALVPPSSTLSPSDIRLLSPSTDLIPANSARAISLDMERLIPHFLGRSLSQTGKNAVMMEAAKVAAIVSSAVNSSPSSVVDVSASQLPSLDSPSSSSSSHPSSTLPSHCWIYDNNISFNKYSGIQEWANNTMFLWINFGDPKANVINSFQNNGREVTWYGGSNMTLSSRVIQKLISVNEIVNLDGEENPKGGIVLWCRQYDEIARSLSPYVCFGRLKLLGYTESSHHPLEFELELKDYDQLMHHQDEAIRNRFKTIIDLYGDD